MHPIAFQIGNVAIHWYGILVAVGFLAGFWTASRRAPLDGLSSESVADIGPWLIVGGLVGARMLYVITYWQEDFAGAPLTDIFKIRQGGLVFYGGFIGAALCGIIYVRKKQDPNLEDGRRAGSQHCSGTCVWKTRMPDDGLLLRESMLTPWSITFPTDHVTHPHAVHPTQIYESFFNFALFAGLTWIYRKKKFDGQVFALYLMAYAFLRAVNELFRGDYEPSKHFGILTPGQLTGILIMSAGIGLWAFCSNQAKKQKLQS